MAVPDRLNYFSCAFRIFLGTFCGFTLLGSSETLALRGADFIEQTLPAEFASDGFPGFLDTRVAPSHRFVIEVPTLALDYGMTDHLTFGSNLASPLLSSLFRTPFLYWKTRYRFFSNSQVSSTLTGYGGGFWPSEGNLLESLFPDSILAKLQNGTFLAVTQNTAIHLERGQVLTLNLMAFRAAGTVLTDSFSGRTSDLSVAGFLPGLGYEILLSRSWSLGLNVLFPIWTELAEENDQITAQFAALKKGTFLMPYRAMANFRMGSSSLLNFGVFGLITGSVIGVFPMAAISTAF